MSHALVEKAMIANLSIGIWQGYKLDREASDKITKGANAKSDAARVNKHLIPKETLAPVATAANAIRIYFYDKTMPWRDNGDRILTRKLYPEFIQAHENLVDEFTAAVTHFIDVGYPAAIAQAEFRMGDLFKRDDYPRAEDLRHRFYARLSFDAVTTADDFRVAIDNDHADRIRADMTKAAEERLQGALQDIWRRIGATVGNFHNRMSNPDAVFRDSTVDNLHDLTDMIPGLNVVDDPQIEAVRRMLEKAFGGVEAKTIRKDPAFRKELASEAQAVLDTMSGFMRAWGAE